MYGTGKCGWFLFLSVCVCVTDGYTESAVIAVYQAVLGTKRCFSKNAEHNNLRQKKSNGEKSAGCRPEEGRHWNKGWNVKYASGQ